jgi:hypothetical protein
MAISAAGVGYAGSCQPPAEPAPDGCKYSVSSYRTCAVPVVAVVPVGGDASAICWRHDAAQERESEEIAPPAANEGLHQSETRTTD